MPSRPRAKHNQMSDMLQLVVKITYTQASNQVLRRGLSVASRDDKLKHVGHLLPSCQDQNRNSEQSELAPQRLLHSLP